jgi:hypothetical protein
MATKSSTKKTSAKKSAAKSASKKRGNVKVTPSSIVFTLNATQKQQAKKCLAETGRIRIGFNEVSITKLGDITNAEVIVN